MNQNLQIAIDSINKGDADYVSQLGAKDTTIATQQNTIDQQNKEIKTLQAQLAGASAGGYPKIFEGRTPNILKAIERVTSLWQHTTDHKVDATHPHGTISWKPNADGWTDVIVNPAMNYDNFYNYFTVPDPLELLTATRFAWEGELSLPTQADVDACQGLETEVEQCINGDTFDTCAWQAPVNIKLDSNTSVKNWRYFDQAGAKTWIDSGIPFDRALVAPGAIMKCLFESYKPDANNMIYTGHTVNGKRTDVNIKLAPQRQRWPGANYLHLALQQDTRSGTPKPAGYRTRVRNLTLYYL